MFNFSFCRLSVPKKHFRFCLNFVLCGLFLGSVGTLTGQNRLSSDLEPEDTVFLITEFGAIGDGETLNTVAIQRTIDTAAKNGGGKVVIPKGVFLSGSIFLKPGVMLQLNADGILLGSQNIEDYPTQMTRIEGKVQPWRMALVNAKQVDGLRITGEGILNGNGAPFWAAFWQRRTENPACTNLEVERPRILYVEQCNDVLISGLKLRDSGFWNLHLYRCQDVTIDGLDIEAPNGTPPDRAPSSDGIDIDSCQWVTVKHCRLSVGDDCIAVKGTKGLNALEDESSPAVEYVLVEDCVFDAGHGVLTLGSEATRVSNMTVRRCVVNGKNPLVRLKLRPDTPQTYENLLYEDITFNGRGDVFNVKPWTQFLDLKGQEPPASIVRNIVVRNLSGQFGGWGRFIGNSTDFFSHVLVENVNLQLENESIVLGPIEDLKFKQVNINGKTFETN